MKNPLVLFLWVAVFALFAPTSAYPGSKSPKTKVSATPVQVYHTTIASISADSITVDLPNNKSATYRITPSTMIYYEGKIVSVDALKSGMRVAVNAGASADVADTILASAAPTSASAPKK